MFLFLNALGYQWRCVFYRAGVVNFYSAGVVFFYTAGVVTRDRRIGSWGRILKKGVEA
jgi:hypothetical protein